MRQCRSLTAMAIVLAIGLTVTGYASAITLPELTNRTESMSRAEREALLVRGAREEKEVLFYGTTPVAQVAVLRKHFDVPADHSADVQPQHGQTRPSAAQLPGFARS